MNRGEARRVHEENSSAWIRYAFTVLSILAQLRPTLSSHDLWEELDRLEAEDRAAGTPIRRPNHPTAMSEVFKRAVKAKIVEPWFIDAEDLAVGMDPRYFVAVKELRKPTGWRTGNPRSSQVYRSLIYRPPVGLDD